MRKVRDECLDEAGARACMEALVTLPGVELPTRPMQVIRRARDVWFDDVAGAKPTAWPKPKDSYDALRFGWRRLADGDAHGALDAVAGLPAGIAIATRIRWRALYDLQDLDALRRSIDADLEELTRHRVPGDAAALEDVTFLIEESGATVSAAMRDALAMAFAVNAR